MHNSAKTLKLIFGFNVLAYWCTFGFGVGVCCRYIEFFPSEICFIFHHERLDITYGSWHPDIISPVLIYFGHPLVSDCFLCTVHF